MKIVGADSISARSLLKKYIIEKSCTKLKFTSTLFKGWQGVKGGRATLSLPQKRNTLN